MVDVRVTFELDDAGVRLLTSPEGEVGRFSRKYADRLAKKARELAPVGLGATKAGIRVQQGRTPTGQYASAWVVDSSAPHSYYAHEGRGPGKMPPREPIARWTRRKGIPDSAIFPIRRKIGRVGTKGKPFLEEAMRRTRL